MLRYVCGTLVIGGASTGAHEGFAHDCSPQVHPILAHRLVPYISSLFICMSHMYCVLRDMCGTLVIGGASTGAKEGPAHDCSVQAPSTYYLWCQLCTAVVCGTLVIGGASTGAKEGPAHDCSIHILIHSFHSGAKPHT